MTDKRIKPRMHRRIPLRVELRLEGEAGGAGRLAEMSEGGLSFVAAAGIHTGAAVTAVVADEQATLRLPGKIVHAGERAGEITYGLQFDPLPASLLDEVRALLKRHRFNAFRVAPHH